MRPPFQKGDFFIMWQKISQSLQLLSQSHCVSCEVVGQGVLCDVCRESIGKPKHSCRICGQAIIGNSTDSRCKTCIQSPPAYESLHCIGAYDEVLSSLIIKAKVAKQLSAVIALRSLVDEFISNVSTDNCDTDSHNNSYRWAEQFADYHLLPMPIPRSRLMQRGFNLPLLLAKRLSVQCHLCNYHLPIVPQHAITQPFFVKKQSKLNRQQRLKNQHHYQINHKFSHKLPKKIIIIDDVVTTGTTVGQLAKFLRGQGVQRLSVWTMARGIDKI